MFTLVVYLYNLRLCMLRNCVQVDYSLCKYWVFHDLC